MPCVDCLHWRHPDVEITANWVGWCGRTRKRVRSTYHCVFWERRGLSHDELGLTPAEVAWGRRHPNDRHVAALGGLFRRITGNPNNQDLRRDFQTHLELWRKHRARERISLSLLEKPKN